MSEIEHEQYPDTHHDPYSKTIFGFWLYLLTDFILFASFFAVYAVLQHGTYGGPSAAELFNLPFIMVQTLIFLTTSLTSGLAGACAHRKERSWTLLYLALTFVLGLIFIVMEFKDFRHFIASGNSWQRSAFLSAFFTIVGTHAVHVLFALLWTLVLVPPVIKEGLTQVSIRRLTCLRMFWQFLNIIWGLVFTIIYCMSGKVL